MENGGPAHDGARAFFAFWRRLRSTVLGRGEVMAVSSSGSSFGVAGDDSVFVGWAPPTNSSELIGAGWAVPTLRDPLQQKRSPSSFHFSRGRAFATVRTIPAKRPPVLSRRLRSTFRREADFPQRRSRRPRCKPTDSFPPNNRRASGRRPAPVRPQTRRPTVAARVDCRRHRTAETDIAPTRAVDLQTARCRPIRRRHRCRHPAPGEHREGRRHCRSTGRDREFAATSTSPKLPLS